MDQVVVTSEWTLSLGSKVMHGLVYLTGLTMMAAAIRSPRTATFWLQGVGFSLIGIGVALGDLQLSLGVFMDQWLGPMAWLLILASAVKSVLDPAERKK